MHSSAFVRRAAGGFGLGLLTAGLVALPTTAGANPAGTALVISEAYGGGGNSGAPYRNDFVELYNPTNAAISVAGHVVEYFAANGNSGGTTTLTGSVPAKGHYLIQMAAGSNASAPALPTPDATGGSNMSATNGSVELRNGDTVLDLVGFGTATRVEGAAAPAPSNTTSVNRNATGADTDNNAADFTTAAPSPTNAGTVVPPPDPDPEPEEPTEASIAEIQGTGATSPLAGDTVVTEGVVTASYPTGGLNGFYIQTPGPDTANASDAVFVYGGSGGFTTYPAVGDSVEVTGTAAEFSGQTQIQTNQAGVVTLVESLGTVAPKAVVPGTTCALPGTECLEGAELDAAREVAEGELFQPTAPWTATDVYDGSPYYQGTNNSSAMRGEIGLAANSDKPLVTPTEVVDAQDTAGVANRTRYNNAHRIILDDGATLTFSTTQNDDQPFPWFTRDHYVRVGAAVTFPKPVVFTYNFGTWRVMPQTRVVGSSAGTVDFEQDRPAAPQNVGGDVKLATFNVLNFFPTTGEEFVAMGGGRSCTYYTDRDGDPISNNRCNPDGPRGAANQENLERQAAKIVAAINTANADIVSLEELENSVKFGKDRDYAINELVKALNADAGAGTWAAVPSAAVLPATSEQDVIRNGFIFKPAKVSLVGGSVVLHDESSAGEAFEDAREPVAQAFKRVGDVDADAFGVIVNHFKSKGSGNPDPFGQGNANDQRVAQAGSLVEFANEFKTQRGISRIFLAGDFNAYSEEDPIQILEEAGYTALKSTSNPEEESYNFDGMVGSLDHVLANGPALADVTGVDIWEINGYESVYYEYARYNSNVTNLYAPNPYRSSDHSPEIVGIRAALPTTPTTPPTPPNAVVPDVTVNVTPDPIIVDRTRAVVHAKVSRAGQGVTTGVVEVSNRGRVFGTAPVTNGDANVKLRRFRDTGTYVLDVVYRDQDGVIYATKEITVQVRKAASDIKIVRASAVAGGKSVLKVKVEDADAGLARGWVRVKVRGEWTTTKLKNGRATFSLGRFAKAGKRTVVVNYNGNASTKTDRERVTFRVKRR
jgi:5'-nucleotidase